MREKLVHCRDNKILSYFSRKISLHKSTHVQESNFLIM